QSWVIRKIDQLAQPVGLNNPVRMQAFEIGTVLVEPSQVAVTVVSETTGESIASLGAPPQPNADYARVINSVDTNVNQNSPAPGNGTSSRAGMLFRALYALLVADANFTTEQIQGILDGLWFGLHSDISFVVGAFQSVAGGTVGQDIKKFFSNAVQAFQMLWEIGKKLKALGVSGVTNFFKSVLKATSPLFTLKNLILLPVLAKPAGYAMGFVEGFLLYLVGQWALITFATFGVGAEAAAMLDAGKIGIWLAEMPPVAAKVVRFLLLIIDPLVALGLDEATIARVITVILESGSLLVE